MVTDVPSTALAMLNEARSFLGYKEQNDPKTGTPGWTRFGQWYLPSFSHAPWCDMFLSYCAAASNNGDVIGKFAYTVAHEAWFAKRGQVSMTPLIGDLAFFDWPGQGESIDHVGVVERVVDSRTIITIEGNTGSGQAGSPSDGVYRRTRSISLVRAFAHPSYLPSTVVSPVSYPPTSTKVPLVVDGIWGPKTVNAFRVFLGLKPGGKDDVYYYNVEVWLKLRNPNTTWTAETVKALQFRVGLNGWNVDGIIGPITTKAVQRYLNSH